MLRYILLMLLVFPLLVSQASAEARALRFGETQELLADGKVISSSTLTSLPLGDNSFGVSPPKDTRIHETFILYLGEVYLCHLVGSKSSGTRPYATCYGSWAGE